MSTTTSTSGTPVRPDGECGAYAELAGAAARLNEEAAARGAASEVWAARQDVAEAVLVRGAVERHSTVTTSVAALTVRKDGHEGYVVHSPAGRHDPDLVDTALAMGRTLPAADAPPAADGPSAIQASDAPEARIDEATLERLRRLSDGPADVGIELRARADHGCVLLQRGGTAPLPRGMDTFQLQARLTAKGERVGYIGHHVFGRDAEDTLAAAEARELPELVQLARVLATEPVPDPAYDDVLVDGRVLARLLMLAVPAFLLDSVLEGRSPLAGRVAERIAAAGVSLTDDPTDPDSPLYEPWDDEGAPCGRTVLIDDGVLRGFLSSRRTAAEAGGRSSGSGRRGPMGEMATVQPGYLRLRPGPELGDRPAEGRTLLKVVQANGAHISNAITGDFSIGANAVLVAADGGQRNAGSLTLAGNVFDLLRHVDGHDGRVRVIRSHHSFVATPGVWTSRLTVGR
ncbi:metallopeptidase TldD-related protein [Streptomyces sp. NPDC045251]|uniref:metallopeptidase TldD-related protein n=1 Tax=unclassified Streptomyces TaxID=2593676 RepID=UPI0034099699